MERNAMERHLHSENIIEICEVAFARCLSGYIVLRLGGTLLAQGLLKTP